MSNNKRASIQTSDVEGPAKSSIDLSSNIKDVERPDLAMVTGESLDSPVVSEYVKDLKFMEDMLTVVVGETTDVNAENPVPAGCNGEKRLLTRGQEYKLQRKFVDSLIKREDKIKTVQYKDSDGVDQTRIDKIPALKYPLSIIYDPAGQIGSRWFQHQCKNAW
jgi:hypothetical protein